MVDELTGEEAAIVALVREFVDREVRPVVRELEHANAYPEKLIEQMKELGVFGLAIPEPWGEAQVSDAVLRGGDRGAGPRLDEPGRRDGRAHRRGQAARRPSAPRSSRTRYLPRMATGEIRATMALTEPGGGSDLQAMRTVARRDGGGYVVNGSKTWITNARRSQLIALLCKTDPAAEPAHKGMSASCSWSTGPGFTVSPRPAQARLQGRRELRAGLRRLPRARRRRCSAGPRGEGFAQMMRGLEIGRIQVACRALGVGRAALEDALRYAQERESVRPADLAAPVDRQLPRRHGHQAGRPPASSSCTPPRRYDSGERADLEAGMAKLFASETAMEIALDAVRIHGGYGYSTEFDVERYFRDAPLMIVGEGTNEIQRNGHRPAAHRAEPDLTRRRRDAQHDRRHRTDRDPAA